MPDFIYAKDIESRFVLANMTVARNIGVATPDELLGKTDFDFFPREAADQYYADERGIIQSGQALVDREELLIDSAGTWRRVSTTKVPLRDSSGNVVGLVGINRDITERKRLEEQLRQSQKMEAVGRLAGGVAHDFNNWLTAIQGYAGLAMEQVDEATPLYRDLQQIQVASMRAADIIRQLLLFSRRQPMVSAPLNINGLVEGLLKMLRRLIGEDIAIETDLVSDLWTVQGDPSNIEQVIVNLAVNARDAMPEGGKLKIATKNVVVDDAYCRSIPDARPGRFVCLAIEDTGVGMSREIMERLFEPFFTTKEPGKGIGLGLATVYGIVKAHNGWINVYSEPGQGATFKVYLPASWAEEEAKVEEKDLLEGWQGSGERILLVEDEEAVRNAARRMLGENGYTVFGASSVAEAMDIFEKEQGAFDLLFSDVVMPGESGLQLAETLVSRKPGLRVLLSSGHADEKSRQAVIKEKGFSFLSKPYGTAQLLQAVKKTIKPGY